MTPNIHGSCNARCGRGLLLVVVAVVSIGLCACAGLSGGPNPSPGPAPLSISNVASSSISTSSAIVSWQSSAPANSQVEFGATSSYGSSTTLDSAVVTAHQQNITGLKASTLYHFRVHSSDASGHSAVSSDFTFTTVSSATAPTITTQPADKTVLPGQMAAFSVVASGTAPLSYQWQKNGASISGATAASYTTPATTTSDNAAMFRVVVSNAAGSVTSNAAVLTVSADTAPPSAPAGLSATAASSSQVNLSWNASTDNVGVAGYQIFRGGALIGTTSTTAHQDTGLASSTSYSYRVTAYDAAGNVSAPSNTVSVTTPSTPPAPARACPPPPEYPTPACTGVPPGTVFTNTVNGNYFADTPGQVIDKWHITGDLIIRVSNVTIQNTQIDGSVNNEYVSNTFAGPYTITDSTVGPASGCIIFPGVNDHLYTAIRVLIRGHDDGFRAGGPDVTIRDSYVKLCNDDPQSHSDGIQDFPFTKNLVLDHNTFDACGAWTTDRSQTPCNTNGLHPGVNSAIFINSSPSIGGGSSDVTITNNLAIGGIISIWLWPNTGAWIVTGNRVVDQTWLSVPYETNGQCANVKTWSDNTIVTMDTSYHITSTVQTAACPN